MYRWTLATWKIARRTKEPLTLLMIDIDHFKQFNDSYGHQAGDSALKRVATSLSRSSLRSSDFVARYGGEEFVILSAGMTGRRATQFADALCQQVRDLQIPHSASRTGCLTVSIGYAVHLLSTDGDPAVLLEKADKAPYAAKQRGRDQSFGG